MARPSLEALSAYGGAALVVPTDGEFAAESPLNLAATALHRFREAAGRFADERAKVEASTRYSAAGREAELGDLAMRSLNELARHDSVLERAQAQLAELVAEARKIPLEDLTPAQLALVPTVYARLVECEPLELPSVLQQAAADRDLVVLGAFFAAPRTKLMRLSVTNDELDAARELAGGPLPADKRKLLARLRELVGAAEATRRALVAEMKRAGKLELDPITLAAFGAEQDKPANDDPIADMATGKATGKAA